ncbi:hypothetical protein RB653_005477 [Dictyostelium firmibasis]|uniref:Uncharacterized protein n=1 Tax=Dictyostelium firmibasis TaxID=79012 RepID=A0AAN7UBJ9_9MYCE
MEGPLILVLVKFFLKFIAYLFSLLAIPITLYSIVLNKILKYNCKDSAVDHFLIFLPRIILVLPFFFSFPLLAYLYGWLVDKAIQGAVYVPFVIAIGFLVAIAIGYWFTRSMSFLKDSISQMKITGDESYIKGLGESLLDIGAVFAFLISIVTVVRIPFMIISLAKRDTFDIGKKSIRKHLYIHMFLIIFDILSLPSFFIVLVTILRASSLFSKIKKEFSTPWRICFNLQLRLEILKNAIIVFLEFGIMLLSFILILAPWRIPTSIKEFKKGKTQSEKFGNFFIQELNALLDLAVILLSLPLIVTLYRIPVLIHKYRQNNLHNAKERRIEALFQTLFIIVDFFILLFSIFILITIYRVPRTIRKIIERPHVYFEIIGIQFLKILIDIPFLLMGLIVTILLWRAPFMYTQIYKATTKRERRKIIKRHFLWLWIDILDLPFVLSSFIILLTLWRSYAFVCGFITMDTRKKQRVFVIKQIFYWLMDIPTFIGLLLITITVYRLPKTIRLLRSYFNYTTYDMDLSKANRNSGGSAVARRGNFEDPQVPPIPSEEENEDNPIPIVQNKVQTDNINGKEEERFSSWRKVVLSQLFLLLIDIPFPILILMTMWRLPILIKRLKEINDPIRSYSLRRLLVLRYVLLTLLDILCLVPALFILLTGWRIPSFVSMVKQYQRGDNEHRLLGLLFWDTLVDIPFVLMGLITMPFLWRGPFLIKTIFISRECKTDKEARVMAAKYLGVCLMDIIIFLELVIITCTMWRFKTFLKTFKDELKKQENDTTSHKFLQTICFFYSTSITCIIIVVDIWKALQLLIICLFIKQIRPLYRAIKNKIDETPDFTLADTLKIIDYYFLQTLMDIPHVFLIPIKLLAFPFIPIHLYLKYRIKVNENERRQLQLEKEREQMQLRIQSINNDSLQISPTVRRVNNINKNSSVTTDDIIETSTTMSFIHYPILWLHEASKELLNYYGLDKFFIINMFGAALILINEMSLIVVLVNYFYMFLVTLGSPLWRKTMEKYGWVALGKASGPMVIFEYITVVLQALLFPVFILIQIAMVLLPTLLALGFYPSPNLDFISYWKGFFSERSFWREASQFSSGIWVAQAFWFLVCVVSWHVTFKVGKKYVPIFSPWKSYYWLVKKVFHGRIWFCYRWLLVQGTRVCYRLRRACLIGELLMFPLFIIWTCWSFIIPVVTKIYYIFIASGIISLGLIVIAYKIVKENWNDKASSANADNESKNQLLMNLQSVECELPESGGIIFKFHSTKSYDQSLIKIKDARLSIEGESLWNAIYQIIGKTKVRAALMVVGYPISLVPMFLDVDQVNQTTETIDDSGRTQRSCSFQLNIGIEGSKFLMKKKLITRLLNQIREINDQPFELVIEYGKKNFGWEKQGTVFKFKTSVTTLFENTINLINNYESYLDNNGYNHLNNIGTPSSRNNNNNNNNNSNNSNGGNGLSPITPVRNNNDNPSTFRNARNSIEIKRNNNYYINNDEIDPEQLEILRQIQLENEERKRKKQEQQQKEQQEQQQQEQQQEIEEKHEELEEEPEEKQEEPEEKQEELEEKQEEQTNQVESPPLPQEHSITMGDYILDDGEDAEEFFKSLDKSNNV